MIFGDIMKKFLLLTLVSLCLFFCFSCTDVPNNGEGSPNQNIEQGIEDDKQSGGEDNAGDNDDSQSSGESDDAEQSGGENIQGTPVPPIQNGGDFEFE